VDQPGTPAHICAITLSRGLGARAKVTMDAIELDSTSRID
jgi:hypothetical protein